MRKKAVFKPKVCLRCGKEFVPQGASQSYCIDCAQIRDKERKEKWHKEHYQYSTRPKKCLEPCCVCGGKFLSHIDGKPYCRLHYGRMRAHGTTSPTQGNTYEFDGDVLKIITSKGDIIIADAEDYEKLKMHSWCISKTGYAVSNINKKVTKLHRYLFGLTDPNVVVDHINHNPLDNRKCNMRICTAYENSLNQSGLKGRELPVGIGQTPTGRYTAEISVSRRTIHLGTFDTVDDAWNARKEAEIKYFGEFAQHLYIEKGLNDSERYFAKATAEDTEDV